ncbi:MAG: hypothetical protein MUF79_14810 [Burkholderiales bacterium]|jgi:hypothetical protein|nr:hypothetical protein [Burkholderiales bacterium]
MKRPLAACLLALAALVSTAGAAELTAREIVERVHAAAGGKAWLEAGTNVMRGDATLCRDGDPAKCVYADRYVMYRVYPTELAHGAHAGSGKFRLDAYSGDKRIFEVAFDGERSYDQNGPLPPERAMSDEMSAFGFSAIRFALQSGFEVERLSDDEVEGRPAFFVRVKDPSGTRTLFGIDKEHFYVLSAQWQTTKGWHMRQYSEFYQLVDSRFVQPGRVRHYYDGVKSVDIHWRSAEIGKPIPDSTFVLGPGVKSAD